MTIDNIISLVAAIIVGGGTLFLGIMAWKSIRQTRSIQKAEEKEKLLNEIIEWAIDVAKCGLEKDLPDISRIADMNEGKLQLANWAHMLALSFQSMRGRNQYINYVVLAFTRDLQEAVDTLIKSVEDHKKLLDILYRNLTVEFVSVTSANIAEYMSQITKSTAQVATHKLKLDEFANKVIEEAAKIKTEDVG